MPELPEVEVVKRSLEKKINKLIIKKVVINTNKLRYSIIKKECMYDGSTWALYGFEEIVWIKKI